MAIYKETDLFGSKEDRAPSVFYKVTCASGEPARALLSVKSAFARWEANADAIMILRLLANQCAKSPQSCGGLLKFLQNIYREIALKNGTLEAGVLARDALVDRFLVRTR
ncbi:MAG: hypothetical protein LBF72_01410 [Holosporales bacterium]|jgi:hypothetical protein|nr:hypothetical protein [Holosporales bacterium]